MDLNELSAVSKLIPSFSGKEDLNNFVTKLQIVAQSISQEKQKCFFDFVFCTTLDVKVQNRLKQDNPPTTIQELISALKTNYKTLKSYNTILNELTSLRQKTTI